MTKVYRCAVCKTFKPATLGKLVKSRARYNTRYFVCDNCRLTPPVSRQARFRHPETPPEREVREALSTCGFKVVAEFQLGKFIYDFAVPKLRLLLEVDSRKFHRLPWQRRKDKLKDAWAKSQHWEVARLPVGPGLGTAALSEVFERARQLGF